MPIPYGYRIEKGKAVIDEVQAEQIRTIYKGYLSGLAYIAAAEAAGLTRMHAGVKSMLKNKSYLGDAYYPAIIDRETYDKAEAERIKRQTRLGRVFADKPVEESMLATKFTMPKVGKKYIDPFKQAEYIYSLIESEVAL